MLVTPRRHVQDCLRRHHFQAFQSTGRNAILLVSVEGNVLGGVESNIGIVQKSTVEVFVSVLSLID